MTAPGLAPVSVQRPRPRVSIVLPTYRRPDMLRQTLPTILGQTFTDFELLIREDAAVDDATARAVGQHDDPRIRFSQSPVRLGIPGILNSLIGETGGEYILVLHDHDLYHPRLVEEMIRRLDAHPSALYAHTATQMIDAESRVTRPYLNAYPELTPGREWVRFMLSRYDCPVCASSMVRRSAHERYGLYDPDCGFMADVELWLRLSAQGDVVYVPEILISVREREAEHEYRKVNWAGVEALLRIHRKYTSLLLPGWRHAARLALRTEKFLIISYLACMKHFRFAKAARREAKESLRRNGGVLSRLTAAIL